MRSPAGLVIMGVLFILGMPASAETDPALTHAARAKLHPVLLDRFAETQGEVKTWVFFTDKGAETPAEFQAAIQAVGATYNPRAVQRRALRGDHSCRDGSLFGDHDLPVVMDYVAGIEATGARVHITSNWLNAVSIWATEAQARTIAELPYVARLEAVRQSKRIQIMNIAEQPAPAPSGDPRALDYGNSTAQLQQINLIALHNAGYTGQGVVIGILDTGFKRSHQAFNQAGHVVNVLAEYDFVKNDPNTAPQTGDASDQHEHGTMILGCIGAYKPGSLVGGAYNASFVLCKTEDTTQEVPAEEDNYVAGLEFIESHGCDMSTASLGYIDWYTQAQLDGQTAVTTIAANILTSTGVHHTNAAGNEYHDTNPAVSHLIAPADAFKVITCGAVNSSGTIASFSSDGPTADGRVKPEILARGVSTSTVSAFSDTTFTTADGTSLSTPLCAAALACLIQAKPYWTVDQMRQHIFEKASYYAANGTHDPQYVLGYGIMNAYATFDVCGDAGVVQLDKTKYACDGVVAINVNDCGPNANPAAIDTVQVTVASNTQPAGLTLTLAEGATDAAEFLGTIALSTTAGPNVLQISPGDTITVTYVDADNGAGGTNIPVTATAAVDCTPPTISSVQVINLQARSATVTFGTNEPARGTVRYGLACDALIWTATGSALSATPTVDLAGLQDETTYFYAVEARDEAGNLAIDPTCRTFTTPDVPDYFTELFTSGNDLDNRSLGFTPNASVDFYRGCSQTITALPTDPAGGTPLTLSDDSYAQVTLTSGKSVKLYGVTYTSFYVGSNGYITFSTSDTDYSETLAEHFGKPRIAALYDDLNPSQGGQVSWKQLADRAVVTWLNVPEHNATGTANTFQIELYFDGKITITYLAIAASDGLAGLSKGLGLPADFVASDLSTLGPCQALPPSARNITASTGSGTPVTITLSAQDDGLPNPPAALDYVIASLPSNGLLKDAGNGALITQTPYTLVNRGAQVVYTSDTYYTGADAFTYVANDGGVAPEGGDSNVATVTVTVTAAKQVVYSWPLDSDPGWTREGLWQYGAPTGGGTHGGDPVGGHTGTHVYGYNINGDYANGMTRQYLTTTAIDCSALTGVELRFWRWLGLQNLDSASIEASADGVNWTTVWQHSGATLVPTTWSQFAYGLSAVADGQPTVYIRWGMGPTDASITYPGWNIDDLELWAIYTPAVCAGDANCDGAIDWRDIDYLVAGMNNNRVSWRLLFQPALPTCPFANLDASGDAQVDWRDIDPFVALMNTACP